MSVDLDEFFARARAAADALDVPQPSMPRRRGDRRRRRQTALIVCSIFVLVASTLTAVTLTTRDRTHPQPATSPRPSRSAAPPIPTTPPTGFAALHAIGTPIPLGPAGRQLTGLALTYEGRGYAAWRTKTPDTIVVAGVDLRTGARIWGPTVLPAGTAPEQEGDWMGLTVVPEDKVLVATRFPTFDPQHPAHTYLLDLETGQKLWQVQRTDIIAGSVLVEIDGRQLVGRDIRTGRILWRHDHSEDYDIIAVDDTVRPRAGAGPVAYMTPLIGILSNPGRLDFVDVHTGQTVESIANAALHGRIVGAVKGDVYIEQRTGSRQLVVAGAGRGVRTVSTVRPPEEITIGMSSCFDDYVCFVDDEDLVALNGNREVWRVDLKFAPFNNPLLRNPAPVEGKYVIVGGGIINPTPSYGAGHASGRHPVYKVVDRSGRVTATYEPPAEQTLQADIVRGGVVLIPDMVPLQSRSLRIAAVSENGTPQSLGDVMSTGLCSAEDDALLCINDDAITTWSFR
jgi:hypothetical protein